MHPEHAARLRLLLEDASTSPRNPDGTIRALCNFKRPTNPEILCSCISNQIEEHLRHQTGLFEARSRSAAVPPHPYR